MFREIIDSLRLEMQRWLLNPKKPQLPQPSAIYPDDVFFVSYPRSGSSWLRRLIALALNPQSSDEVVNNINAVIPDMYVVGERLAQYSRPRMIKSHELYQPLYPKVIYLYRDGRDVSVSYYNFYRAINQYPGTLDEFLRLFVKGQVGFGRWDMHIRSWMFRESSSSPLAVAYEELHSNTNSTVARVMEFLGYSRPPEAIQKAVEVCTFVRHQEVVKNFSPHYATGYRGGVGGKAGRWRENLSPRQSAMLWEAMGHTLNALGYRQN